ncbi:MAG: T9SS type A sorting domain-containing protein [Bacteroidetes bacterium]|nr:T9SS type A sorting domain-containing protein [Bacteroidota bacterium]
MRRFLPMLSVLLLSLFAAVAVQAQIKSDTLTIQQIQEVDPDTLAAGNQNSPHVGDTITVTGAVFAAPRISAGGPPLFALGNAFTLYIMDENGGPWSGLNVRATDSLAADAILVTAIDTGYVVRLTGVVTQYYSTTQFEIGIGGGWNADALVEIIDDLGHRPDPTKIEISDLVNGTPLDLIPMSQQWEGAYVLIEGASVGSVSKNPSSGRYTWTITDGAGNSIGVYDQSVYFRGGAQGFDPNWAPPAPGTTISAIRGVITSSGQGIVIAPLYPGDMVLGSFPPIITDLARDLALPTSSDLVTVTCSVEDSNPGGTISDVTLVWGMHENDLDVEKGQVTMTYDASSKQAMGQIPAQADGSIVWYYIQATDNDNETVVFPGDVAVGKPFYIVHDGDLRIRDIQYTPYSNGNSGAVGGTVTIRGTVVSSADDLGMTFIQDDTAPWSGLMVRGDESIRLLQVGQDVTITGEVAEYYNVTTIINATLTNDNGTATVPDPIELTTGAFETLVVRDGNASAEPWEGMLTIFKNLSVTSSNADDPSGNFGEILVDDGSGDMRIDDSGTWKAVYTNDPTQTDKIFLSVGTTIESVTGIMYFSFSYYKLEPRTEADFVNVGEAVNPPIISKLARDKGIPTSSDDVTVTCEVVDSNEGGTISKVDLFYGTEGGNALSVSMTYDAGTNTATGVIPAMADGDVVWYYIEATDNDDDVAVYPADLNGPLPFFIVRDGNIRIRDIQYTPYSDGRSGSVGFKNVTTRGTLTSGPNIGMYFIQDDTNPWSGIQIYSSNIKNEGLVVGDDITVTGTVDERYGITQLKDVVIDTKHGTVTVPDAVLLQTNTFENESVPDGDLSAEPYEGMFVKFENLTVTSDNADAAAGSNFGEFLVTDGTGDMRVNDTGTWDNVYTTDSSDTGMIYLKPGTTISGLQGIMYFSFLNWKLEPRTEDDFDNVVTAIEFTPVIANDITLHQNYPNPFTADAGTSIRFDLPKQAQVSLRLFDVTGRLVSTLLEGSHQAGSYTVRFALPTLPAGIYLYSLTVDGSRRTARMIITR